MTVAPGRGGGGAHRAGFALALELARRELRGGLKGFRVLLACLALGVGAIVGVGSLSSSIVAGLAADGRRLLGGDVDLSRHNQPLAAAEVAWVRDRAAAVSQTIEMRAMARAGGGDHGEGAERPALVELKAVDAAYPLVGAVRLEPEQPLERALARRDGAWGAVAEAGLLGRLGLAVGDRLAIGDATLVVRARLAAEPDRVATVANFGPRLMVAEGALAETGLVRPGSQIHHHLRALVPADWAPGPWIEALEAQFPKAGWRVRAVDEAAPGIRRFIERMTLFLTFVALTVLLVGGIGVTNAVKSHLDGKTATIATLKCLGAPARLVFQVYLLQVLALAGGGIALGLVAGAALPAAGVWALAEYLPVEPRLGLYPQPLAQGAAFGLLTAVTFALWPLAAARHVSAARLFRDIVSPVRARPAGADVAALGICAAALAALVVATTSERYFALWFVGGTLATFLVLGAGAAAIRASARRMARRGPPAWRLALASLHRPGNGTTGVTFSLGLGLAVLVAVALVQANLGRQIDERLPEQAPTFFFIDIQSDQVAAFDAAVADVPGASQMRRVPTLRGRIVAIAGVPVESAAIAPGAEWGVRGDRVLTYAARQPAEAQLVAGAWWPPDYRGPPAISLDANLARGFGVGVGDTLTLNVLGREITARIASLREIDWRSLRFDFAIIFAPGMLEAAPQTHIAAVSASRQAEDAVERAVTTRFANVSSIRVREALEAAARILAGIGAAVRGTAAVGIAAGALVLAGAVAAGRRRRIYDAVVLKVLGATRPMVLAAFVIELGILGAATGLVAALVGSAAAWAVVILVMGMPWTWMPGWVAATVAASAALTLVVGFAGTWRALGETAAAHLRNR